MQKTLTISIAAYNVDKYLENTMNSLVTIPEILDEIEIIIEDDGSKDNTINIANRYREKFPQTVVVNSCANGGYGATINRSIAIANGKYFKQLDGDDWFESRNMYEFIEYLKMADSDYVVTPYNNCYEDGEVTQIDHFPEIDAESCPIQLINKRVNIAMHELTIKTALLKNNNINITEHCFYTDNEYTFMPLCYATSVSRFQKPIYCYRLGREGQSVSLEGIKKHYKDAFIVANCLYDAYKKKTNNNLVEISSYKIELITDTVYSYCLAIGTFETKKELIQFDQELKDRYPEIYMMTNKVNKIRIIRKSKFILFHILSQHIRRKWA